MTRFRNSTILAGLPVCMAMGITTPALAQEVGLEDEAAVQLETVVITATGTAQTLPDAPATVSVIDGDEITSKPYATVADVLRTVPGVIVSAPSGRSGSETISIRGLGESYVLTLVDGRPIGNSQEATYNGFGSGLAMSYLPPPSAIERIEVIRGPMSSLYGTAASGGVINIITKPVSDAWTGSMTLGYSKYKHSDAGDANEGRFYLSGPLLQDRLGLSLFGARHDRQKDEMIVSGRGGDTVQSQDIERKSLGARLTWAMTENQNLKFDTAYSSQDTTSTPVGGEPGGIRVKRTNYGLSHDITWGDDYRTDSFLTHEDVDFENGSNVSGYKLLNLNSKTALSLGRHDLTVGIDYRDETTRHDPDRVSVNPKMSRWNWALFGEDSFHLTDDLTLTFGLRYDDNQRYGSQITPRAYAVWHANPALTLKGGVSGGYKTPTLKQADSNIFEPSGGDGRARDQGNTDLKPEESTNYEIGAIWETQNGVQLGLNAYHTRFKNKITTETICAHDEPEPGLPTDCGMNGPGDPIKWISQYVNRDRAELNGIEATVDFAWRAVDVSFNYTYADSKITSGEDKGAAFNNSPLHVANLALDWQASEALSLWTNLQYRSSTTDSGSNFIREHAIIDLGLDYEFNQNVMGSLAVYNIDDQTFGNTGYNDGRRFYMGVTSTF
ncbi:TonB-dependent receptor [Paracoccus yeei]|uniref:TonB-dependent receptor n=1 Tax=Paracoccus yeei TaxID=147645 RepID=A0A386UQ03_9RHOB|nr:TonB-dependent receptor [Paracoccus yeei]AYF02190.1 TonB-dependent receptor [Paracoccus yeei]